MLVFLHFLLLICTFSVVLVASIHFSKFLLNVLLLYYVDSKNNHQNNISSIWYEKTPGTPSEKIISPFLAICKQQREATSNLFITALNCF
jgi:hypothetical protein